MKELLEQAELLEREKKFDQAAEIWRQVAAAGGQNLAAAGGPPLTEIQKRHAGAHFQAGNFDQAIDILNSLPGSAENAEILGLLTRAYLEKEQFEQAVKVGRRAIEIEPEAVQTNACSAVPI